MNPTPTDIPAAAGGLPLFPERLPLVRPRFAAPEAVASNIEEILRSGILTNGPFVRRFESRAAEYLGVRHCVAVSSCTTGLMLVLRVAELTGEVILPSFTFAATAHAADWNGLVPVFADIDPDTLTLDTAAVEAAVGMRTSAILATHVYGTPCDVDGLTAVAKEHGLRLFFDAAHAFGSNLDGRMVAGFGDAEVFSLSPSKVLVAAEGGLITTDDDLLAERCRIGLDYGNPGDYDCLFVGLNGRMSELHAATALASLEDLDDRLEERNRLAGIYRESLIAIPGLAFPAIPEGGRSTYKDLAVLIDPERFGASASVVAAALEVEGVETRRYFDPPVHLMRAYRDRGRASGALPATIRASQRVLCLPLWVGIEDEQVWRVAEALERIRRWIPSDPLRSGYAGKIRDVGHGLEGHGA